MYVLDRKLIYIHTYVCSSEENILDEPKYIVYKSCLDKLCLHCPKCSKKCSDHSFKTSGSLLTIHFNCDSCDNPKWFSQPLFPNSQIPAGNIQLIAAILFTGLTYTRVNRMFEAMGIQFISKQLFHRHQKKYLFPTIYNSYRHQQENIFEKIKENESGLIILGDGRSDTPGHSAIHGSYTIMDSKSNKVIDQQLVQVSYISLKLTNVHMLSPLPYKTYHNFSYLNKV